jgi:transcriptional regulator with XRE-family HTH domain
VAVSTGAALSVIGASLRAAREQRGLTLEQAAELSGLSKSHLSRLESSDRQPSVAALLSLSDALGVPMSALLGEGEGGTAIATSTADESRRESNGLLIAPCSGFAGSNVIDALRVTVTPDRPNPPPTRHPGEEWLYVVEGTLRLEYDGEVYRLERSATAHFNAELPHRLAAEAGPTEVLLVAAKPVCNMHQIH